MKRREEKDKVGVIHGRFQLLHNDHMKYLLAGKERCEHLIIGICNPEVDLTKYTDANPHRSKKSSNPLTYFERMECIKNAMIEAGVKREEFDIVPFPINFPDKIFNYVPLDAKFYMTIYDDWGEEKLKSLRDELNLDVEVLWRVTLDKKGISASDVRKCIQKGASWREYVPKSVYDYIRKHKLDLRIKKYLDDENE
ncbi:MAG: adenylyltransferase/cytidyltransferase family protein [Candidatus Saccharibacteria bacterium]|nr:adenylyltransferase/cytidyltransferase family protein [Candidatus Saccharibacteria bacterium]